MRRSLPAPAASLETQLGRSSTSRLRQGLLQLVRPPQQARMLRLARPPLVRKEHRELMHSRQLARPLARSLRRPSMHLRASARPPLRRASSPPQMPRKNWAALVGAASFGKKPLARKGLGHLLAALLSLSGASFLGPRRLQTEADGAHAPGQQLARPLRRLRFPDLPRRRPPARRQRLRRHQQLARPLQRLRRPDLL